MTREEIYNEVIQDYSHLQYELEGDELQDKINEIVDDILHEQSRELMEKLIVKYKLKDVLLSLDEFVVEYSYILHPDEIKEINNLINKF